MKNTHSTAGRRTNKPPKSKKRRLGHFLLVVADVRGIILESRRQNPTISERLNAVEISVTKTKSGTPKIAFKNGPIKPPQIEDKDIDLILEVLAVPSVLRKPDKAIQWAKLFCDFSGTMIEVLPKIQHRLTRIFSSSQEKVVWYFSFRHNLHGQDDDFCQKFYVADAKVLAGELSILLENNGITERTIEHARSKIISLFPPQKN